MELPSSVFNKRLESCPNPDDLYKHFCARPSRLPTPDHVLLPPEFGLVPQCMGNPQLVYPENIDVVIKSGSQHHSPPEKSIGLPVSPSRAISPFRPGNRLRPLLVASEGPRLKLEPSSYRSSASKIASNDKHNKAKSTAVMRWAPMCKRPTFSEGLYILVYFLSAVIALKTLPISTTYVHHPWCPRASLQWQLEPHPRKPRTKC
jgi:hypothetical protein